MGEIEKIQQAAMHAQEKVHELGVFVLFSMKNGSAWVLETTDSDAVQVAEAGQPLNPPISENSVLIEVDWSHTFALRERRLFLTDYGSGIEGEIVDAPTQQINAAIRRSIKNYPAKLRSKVHLKTDEPAPVSV